jgi:hypothetical protein
VSGRCSPTEAVNLLRREFSATAAAKKLTDAIHDNEEFRLWCDSVLIKPNPKLAHIAAIARVISKFDQDEGRWTADIESTGPGLAWERGRHWQFDVDDVVSLLPAHPGPIGVNWEIHATLEMERLGRKVAQDMRNSGQLLPHLKRILRREIKFVPKDHKRLTAIISAFLHFPN